MISFSREDEVYTLPAQNCHFRDWRLLKQINHAFLPLLISDKLSLVNKTFILSLIQNTHSPEEEGVKWGDGCRRDWSKPVARSRLDRCCLSLKSGQWRQAALLLSPLLCVLWCANLTEQIVKYFCGHSNLLVSFLVINLVHRLLERKVLVIIRMRFIQGPYKTTSCSMPFYYIMFTTLYTVFFSTTCYTSIFWCMLKYCCPVFSFSSQKNTLCHIPSQVVNKENVNEKRVNRMGCCMPYSKLHSTIVRRQQ